MAKYIRNCTLSKKNVSTTKINKYIPGKENTGWVYNNQVYEALKFKIFFFFTIFRATKKKRIDD